MRVARKLSPPGEPRVQGPVWELEGASVGRRVRVTAPEPFYCAKMTKRMERIDSKLLRAARGEPEVPMSPDPEPPTRRAPPATRLIDPESADPFGGLILVEGEPLAPDAASAREPEPFSKPIDR